MKYIYTIALLLALSGIRIHAQKVDTSLTQMGLKSKIFSADSVRYAIYNYAKRSPFYLSDLMPIQYSSINGGYSFEKGKLMAAQNAEKIQNSYLQTEGSTSIGSVRLWGLFSYLKSYEDSTMYNHQTRNNSSVPFYFGSPIQVKYERSVYRFRANGETELIKKNLPFGLGADYRIGNHFSSNDPRGSINDFQFNLITSLGYKLSEQLKLGTAYRLGYGQERFGIGYKNTSYQQANVKPEYTNYLINGYGEAWESKNILDYDSDQNRYGFDVYLNYQSAGAGTFLFSYGRINEKQKFTNRTSLGFSKYGSYSLIDDSFNLLWFKKIATDELSLNLAYLNRDGKDNNYVFEQNNYLYNNSQLSIKAILTSQRGKNQYNYTVSANKNTEERQDGITGNLVGYNQFRLNAGWGFSRTTKKAHHWGLNLNGVYTFSFDNDFDVPLVTQGQFTRRVILYDYLYNTASVFGGNFNADYSFPALKGVQAGIRLGVSYLQRADMATLGGVMPDVPGKDRFSSNASINFYF